MNLKRTAVALLCAVILLVSGAVPKAFADWYDDIESGSWVKITGQNFVADTFMGVNAYYNASGNSVYHCGEVVERFYREALGLDVEIRSSEPRLRMNTPGYKLVTPDFPKAGDVVFVSSAMRGGRGDHWAIVKYYENGYLVLFEQNVSFQNGAALFHLHPNAVNGYVQHNFLLNWIHQLLYFFHIVALSRHYTHLPAKNQ